MLRHELLKNLHDLLQPRTYLEIGVSTGRSITLSRTRTIGVDPAYNIVNEILCDIYLARTTSDEFFARKHPLAHFAEPVVDLAFIDGMHLAEYALRDVINVERYALATSVIVLDDMLPRNVGEAGRSFDKSSGARAWAGDVYKLISAIRSLRPDLVCLEMDTQPTGTLVLLLPDASSDALSAAYDDLVEEYVVPDPQVVPQEILGRTRAIQPERLFEAPIWTQLRELRNVDDDRARPVVRELLRESGLVQ
jgi:hypothetical protein